MRISLDYPRVLSLALALALPAAAACGGDDDGDDDGGDEIDDCVETDVLPQSFRPIAQVSEGEVDTSEGEDGATDAVIDATAGGFMVSGDNPFIYIDLEAGEKVDIDDVDAYDSDEWDIAFKRANIRINGGDSGTGGVEVAVVEAETLADVTDEPPDGDFVTDEWADENCELIALPDTTPTSAFGEWYNYEPTTMFLTPKAEVHVVRTRSGDLVKVEIHSYYVDEETRMGSATYSVSWAPL